MPRVHVSKPVKKPKRVDHYDCSECPGYCCSIYSVVAVTPKDLRRLADHFGVGIAEARMRYTRLNGRTRVLRRQKDPVLKEACYFLDLKKRRCTIYEGRPEACRAYPGQDRCAYYDVLHFERSAQDDERALPLIQITFPTGKKAWRQ